MSQATQNDSKTLKPNMGHLFSKVFSVIHLPNYTRHPNSLDLLEIITLFGH